MKSGFVALVGRPNVGKSTLVNALLREKVAIVSPKPQTTRTRIHGILNRPDAQIILVDTPGLCAPKSALHKVMGRVTGSAAADADVALLVAEVRGGPVRISEEDLEAIREAKKARGAVILVLNKIDRLNQKEELLPWLAEYQTHGPFAAMVPISATKCDGLNELQELLVSHLPEGQALFPRDLHTDQAERFICAELVREQLLYQTRDEVPHCAAVVIESFEDMRDDSPDGGLCRLEGRIYVERKSQKGIVVGKGGQQIKALSQAARQAMEHLLGSKVYVRLTVHVDENWTKKASSLQRFGISDDGTAL